MKTTLRIAALLALSFFAISAAPAQSPSRLATTIVVLANRQTQKRLWPVLVSTLRREAAAASQSAPIDGDPQIILGGGNIPGPVFPSRIEVELLGSCDDPWNANPPAKNGPLGYVREDAGLIAPVIYVDCAQINQLMADGTRTMTEKQRLSFISEAISHVILHEWTHIATQSPAHTSRGIMQSALSLHELTTPVADTGSPSAKTHDKSENGGEAGLLVRGFTLLIGDDE